MTTELREVEVRIAPGQSLENGNERFGEGDTLVVSIAWARKLVAEGIATAAVDLGEEESDQEVRSFSRENLQHREGEAEPEKQ